MYINKTMDATPNIENHLRMGFSNFLSSIRRIFVHSSCMTSREDRKPLETPIVLVSPGSSATGILVVSGVWDPPKYTPLQYVVKISRFPVVRPYIFGVRSPCWGSLKIPMTFQCGLWWNPGKLLYNIPKPAFFRAIWVDSLAKPQGRFGPYKFAQI